MTLLPLENFNILYRFIFCFQCFIFYSYAQIGFFFFFGYAVACGSLVPWPRIKPKPLQWKHWVLTTGMPGNTLTCGNFKRCYFCDSIQLYLTRIQNRTGHSARISVTDKPTKSRVKLFMRVKDRWTFWDSDSFWVIPLSGWSFIQNISVRE